MTKSNHFIKETRESDAIRLKFSFSVYSSIRNTGKRNTLNSNKMAAKKFIPRVGISSSEQCIFETKTFGYEHSNETKRENLPCEEVTVAAGITALSGSVILTVFYENDDYDADEKTRLDSNKVRYC